MILGFAVGLWLIPEENWQVHLFLGATLSATSVGITARVLKDLGRSTQRESRIILGAAVIDDVLGLLVLAVVTGIIRKGKDFQTMSLIWEPSPDGVGMPGILVMSVGFLAIAIVLGGLLVTRPLFRAANFLQGHGLLVATAMVICFGMSYVASLVQLAPIVGAFAAGLILEHAQYRDLSTRENWELERAVSPLTAVFVPIFFVQMGIEVKLSSFADPAVWGLAAAVTAVAIIGKQVCSLGVLEKGLDRLSVGLGMIPRGEVGLIFAAAGKALMDSSGEPVVSDNIYSAIIVMVILTTMVTPPLLKWSMTRGGSPLPGGPEPPAAPVPEHGHGV
jgi:Kef-type K+ transport system membrane component KefB